MQVAEILDRLQDPRQFVCLCRDLLMAEGALSVRGAGQGNDQGADIIADVSAHSPVHDQTVTFLVQCKWYQSGKSVGSRVLSEGLSSLDLHGARGLLIITTSTFSGTAISHANAISKGSSSPHIVALWDREEVIRRLRRHPKIAAAYLYPASSAAVRRESGARQAGKNVEHYLCREVPVRYASHSVATFPEGHLDDELRGQLELLEATFSSCQPVSVIVKGGVFSGKSGLAWSLIVKATKAGASFLALTEFYFRLAFFFDEFHGQSLLPHIIKEFRDAEIVFVQDLGSVLKDRSPLQERAATLLKELIQERVSQGGTVIIECRESLPRDLREYIDYLSATIFVARMPDSSVGGSVEKLLEEFRSEGELSEGRQGAHYLGRSWLLEKYEKIRDRLESLRGTLLKPEEEHLREEELIFQISGDPKRSRIQAAIEELEYLRKDVDTYSIFVESLPFHAIAFEDGKARLLPRLGSN